MPPQVGKAGGTSYSASSTGVEDVTKSGDSEKKLPENQKTASEGAAPRRVTSQEVASRKAEAAASGLSQRAALNNQLDTNANPAKPQQQRKTSKNSDHVWENVKRTVNFAAKSLDKGAHAIGNVAADAGVVHLAEKANAHIMEGIGKQKEIILQKKGEDLATEVKRVASGKPSFAESERVIQKIDSYRREVKEAGREHLLETSGLYHQEIRKAPRMTTREMFGHKVQVKSPFQEKSEDSMTVLLGAYGYDKKLSTRESVEPGVAKISQEEILDTALHNWRVSTQEERQALQPFARPPITTPKNWKTPIDISQENRNAEANQFTMNPQTQGNYMGYPASRERENQPDPEQVLAQGKKNYTDASFDVINSFGGGLPAKGGRTNAGKRGTAPEWSMNVETRGGSRPQTTSSPSPESANGQESAATKTNNASHQTSQKSDSKADAVKQPQVIKAGRPFQEGWRKNQERRVEEAIGQLDKPRLNALRDLLRDQSLLDQPSTDKRNHRIPLQEEIIRERHGMNLPGDKQRILAEVRKALEKSADPRVNELLENHPQGREILEELSRLRDARREEEIHRGRRVAP
jgi:hypothetical protein